jgi:hypothetical protein
MDMAVTVLVMTLGMVVMVGDTHIMVSAHLFLVVIGEMAIGVVDITEAATGEAATMAVDIGAAITGVEASQVVGSTITMK